MREHSSRLISEYNKKLDKLQKENRQLKETLRTNAIESQDSESSEDHMNCEEKSVLKKDLEELLVKFGATSSELEEVRRSHSESLLLISSLKDEISDLNEKLLDRDRVIEEAKCHLNSLEETSEHLSRSFSENSGHSCDSTAGNQQEIQENHDSHCDNVYEKSGVADVDFSPPETVADSAVVAVETSVSVVGENPITELLQAKKNLEELLRSERREYKEKLASLRTIADSDNEDIEVLQQKYFQLNEKYDDIVGELENTRSAYSNALVELAATQSDNDKLTKNRDELVERINCCELEANNAAGVMELKQQELIRLSEHNTCLLEKIRDFEQKFSELQENEWKKKLEIEELAKQLENEKVKFGMEKEELLEKIEDYGHTVNFLEIDQSEKREMCGELAQQCRLLKEELHKVKAEHHRSVDVLNTALATINVEYNSTVEKAKKKIDDLQSTLLSKSKELSTVNDQNKLLMVTVNDLIETVKSTEEDLEATRSAFANQVDENHYLKAKLERIFEQVANDPETASAAQTHSRLKVEELEEQLAKSNAIVDALTARLEATSRNAPIEEIEKQLTVPQTCADDMKFNSDLSIRERDLLSEELKRTKQQLDITADELSTALRRCEEIEEERLKLESKLDAVRKSEESLSRELRAIGEEQLVKEAFQDQLVEKSAKLCEDVESLEKKVSDLEARNDVLTQELSVFHENEELCVRRDNELAAVTSERDDLLQRNASLDQANKDLYERLAAVEFDCQSARERCTSLEADLLELKDVTQKVDDLSVVLRSKENEVVSLKGKIQLLEEELLIAKVNSDTLSEQIEGLTITLADRNTSLARCEAECAALQIEVAEHNKKVNVQHLQSSVERKRSEETIIHLRDDNIRLEKELFFAHEQLESTRISYIGKWFNFWQLNFPGGRLFSLFLLQSELGAVRQSLEHSEALAMATRNENQRLVEQLEHAMFEREQTILMAGEGKEAATRVLTLERSIAQLKGEHDEKMEQVLGDLEASEQRLRVLNDKAEEAFRQRDDSARKISSFVFVRKDWQWHEKNNITFMAVVLMLSMNQMESWRERFELAAQEIESLTRAIGEVHRLEAALEQGNSERTALYQKLTTLQSYVDQVVAEKDALLAQLAALNGQLDERTNRLRQVGEAKMDTTLRIVELESQIAALLREREAAECSPDVPLSNGVSNSTPTEHVAVQIEFEDGQENTELLKLRTELQRAERRIAELEEFERVVGDSHRGLNAELLRSSQHSESTESSHFISASTPFPSLVTLLSRRLSAIRRRPQRALFPYFRYIMAGYAVMLHMMLIHCWFFAGCPM
ncbi:hypothetical protein NECAME_08718 [Necator americanus]|uniref:Uncharacterized protein n=1 Tax=Necator americanus TaxID=51031 RepID=W2TJ97_NECAM|nr:hypothetical protein NECAME_08718 [Necator americanus]ETN81097.1 hypothetical protein NECAME_08718 [Necator americanus]